MLAFLNDVLDTLVRNVPQPVKIIITIIALVLAVFSFRHSIRVKEDNSPIGVGSLILCVLLLIVAMLYMFL